MTQLERTIICLMGPTASGKTDLALRLAATFPSEIISVDSVLVYRGMDIGTAKPALDMRVQCPHHLIDICDPITPYSAATFRRDALQLIDAIIARGKVPILVGGTMLYFRALQFGLDELPSANPQVRDGLVQEAQQWGWPGMHIKLTAIDPVAAATIKPTDSQRIQRAWEVYLITGKPLSEHWKTQKSQLPYHAINIALVTQTRACLHQRIEQRLQWMLTHGFVDEVRALYQRSDLSPELPALRAVGYRQLWQYLSGELDYETATAKALVATRQLAKRQLTWLRQWPDLHEFELFDPDVLTKIKNVMHQPVPSR